MPAILTRMRGAAVELRRDARGLAATEFAMIVPLMLLLFFGTTEISTGVAIDRKVTLVAHTLSDLTSRSLCVEYTGCDTLTNFFAASYGIMWPYSSTPVNATISELYIDPKTSLARVQWSQGSAPRSTGSTMTIPSGLIATDSSGNVLSNQYLIFSEVSYLYKPAIGYVVAPAGITLKDTSYTRPRQLACVHYQEVQSNPCPTK
ncbi:MAG TPA: TadE/TadG family type IV pilus assembly protein [Nitrobacter sp.]|nr:TadE/TadG family type IV pilus assembly protein [Nitrobacter sp.]